MANVKKVLDLVYSSSPNDEEIREIIRDLQSHLPIDVSTVKPVLPAAVTSFTSADISEPSPDIETEPDADSDDVSNVSSRKSRKS